MGHIFPSRSSNGQQWQWQECAKECALNEECEFWTLRLTGNTACLLMKNQSGSYSDVGDHVEGDKDLGCLDWGQSPSAAPSARAPPSASPTALSSEGGDGVCIRFATD
jgi:hypothetical protein